MEEREVAVEEIIEALTGTDPDGKPKAIIGISLARIKGEAMEEVSTFAAFDAVFSDIDFMGELVAVVIDHSCADRNMWKDIAKAIDDYFDFNEEAEDEGREGDYGILFTVTSMQETLGYHMLLMNPIQSADAEDGSLDLLFDAADVAFVENDLNPEEIKADVLRELEALADFEEEAETDQEDFLEPIDKERNPEERKKDGFRFTGRRDG